MVLQSTVWLDLVNVTCWCGLPLAVPSTLYKQATEQGVTLYCPVGHKFHYGDTLLDKTRREAERLKQQTARLESELIEAKNEAAAEARKAANAQKQAKTAKTQFKNLRKRSVAGVCPCCHRTFSNVQRHMQTKHADVIGSSQATK